MQWKPWVLLTGLVTLSIGVIGFYGAYAFQDDLSGADDGQDAQSPVAQDAPLVTFVDPQKGAPNGDVIIVEYGGHACPYCRQLEEVIDRLIAEYPDRITFVWKDLPSPVHTGSASAAEAAHCAKDQGRFWAYHQALFENQGVYTDAGLSLLANELELDLQRFGACLSSREKRYLVERSVSEAQALGVDSTPYLFINGERYTGQLTYEALENAAVRP